MKRFLQQNKVTEEYFGAGLILRTFLQMIELRSDLPISLPITFTNSSTSNQIPDQIEECPVKIEEMDSYDEIGFRI